MIGPGKRIPRELVRWSDYLPVRRDAHLINRLIGDRGGEKACDGGRVVMVGEEDHVLTIVGKADDPRRGAVWRVKQTGRERLFGFEQKNLVGCRRDPVPRQEVGGMGKGIQPGGLLGGRV